MSEPPLGMTRPPGSWYPVSDEQAARLARDEWSRERGRPPYPHHVTAVLRMRGALDAPALERALEAVCQRHSALRLRISGGNGEWRQQVAGGSIELERVEDAIDEDALESIARRSDHTPFDPSTGRPARAALARLGREDHALVLTVDHLVCDGWSRGVLLRDLGRAYASLVRGEAPCVDSDRVAQFPEVVAWMGQPDRDAEAVQWWRERLRGQAPAPEFALAFASPAPMERRRLRGHTEASRVTEDVQGRLRALQQRARVTPFVVSSAAFQALLHRYTGEGRIVLPTPVAGRDWPHAEDAVGWYATRVPLVVEAEPGLPASQWLRRARASVLEVMESIEVPYARLVRELQPDPPGGPPAYDADATFSFVTRHLISGAVQPGFPGLEVDVGEPVRAAARSTLALVVDGSVTPWRVALRVDAAEVSPEAARAVVADYLRVLEWLAADAEDRPLADVPLELATDR